MAEFYVSEHEEEHNEQLFTLGECSWCGETALDNFGPMDEDEESA